MSCRVSLFSFASDEEDTKERAKTYDRMASHLVGSGSEAALQVARDLDAKVIRLLTEATGT
jgi:hypothetical protein